MWVGELVGGRFLLERPVGAGGMGSVFFAKDQGTGEAVALKTIDTEDAALSEQFLREAHLLARLRHPAVVRYVAHGVTGDGEPYLAMEWLRGETLRERLRRAPLTPVETVELGRRIAEALEESHQNGIVHRDVKPTNILLERGEPGQAKLLDFGIARVSGDPATAAGTAGYMAPEQAAAERDVDPRTDLFSLGCVLFECLTGRPAFAGEQRVAVLAKVLCDEPPEVSHLAPGVPPPLESLVSRLLCKRPQDRPGSAGEVVEALGASRPEPAAKAPVRWRERLIGSVILAEGMDVARCNTAGLQAIVEGFGGEVVRLSGGGHLVWVSPRAGAAEPPLVAAPCALALQRAFPGARIAVATGRDEGSGVTPAGPAIDRAARLLRAAPPEPGLWVDSVTARLVENRFAVTEAEGLARLQGGVPEVAGPSRLVLGKATPFVGRAGEMALIGRELATCIGERSPRAVVIVGPPGIGKSRLCREVAEWASSRGVRAVVARADAASAGSSLRLAARVVRALSGAAESAPAEEQRRVLSDHVGAVLKGAQRDAVTEMLEELLGIGAPSPSARVQAARNDPGLLAEQLRSSFREWLRAVSAQEPLLLLIDDLHWGDLASATYLGDVLAGGASIPLMVVAFARPELSESLPGLWGKAARHDHALSGLSRSAAEGLAQGVLGSDASAALVTRIVERADGNPFYLEELMRSCREQGTALLPESVMAVIEGRLARLAPEPRHLLRAASVFGETFWEGAAAALVGASPAQVRAWLEPLLAAELVDAERGSRFPGERQLSFRHALVRDAALATLDPSDARSAHRIAGEWLERAGETDAPSLSDHFDLGGAPERALPWLVRAVDGAYAGGSLSACLRLAERALSHGPSAALSGRVQTQAAWAELWRGEWGRTLERAGSAMALLEPGSTDWFRCASATVIASACIGDPAAGEAALVQLLQAPAPEAPSGPYGLASFLLVAICYEFGRAPVARSFVDRLDGMLRSAPPDPAFHAWVTLSRCYHNVRSDEPGLALQDLAKANELLAVASDPMSRMFAQQYEAMTRMEVEQHEGAAAAARALLERADELDIIAQWGAMYLSWATVQAGAYEEGIRIARPLLDGADHLLAQNARCAVAEAELELGRDPSETAAAILVPPYMPDTHANALCVLSRYRLRRSEPAEALALAERGLAMGADGVPPRASAILRLARIEALLELGRTEDAARELHDARRRILRISEHLGPEERDAFLHRFRTNARTLELARAHLD